ncbi:MAG: 5-(carboxyamino)imidazole ribonucleotide mutase [Chlorobiales bacterium]|nr:5-(carboxyamino)imidazole ribonucleotide mutase [Chlorobiales bacterium]
MASQKKKPSQSASKSSSSAKSASSKTPDVGIIMGSDSDLETMKEAAKVLQEFKIPYEIRVVSAHRTPDDMAEYAKTAIDRGLKVIIAGAGGAAHLPGMTASHTTLPVIGVPVVSRALSGVDSLYSIVQMPAGIPVATVAIGNAKNAGLLAAQILSIADSSLQEKLQEYRKSIAEESRAKNKKL